MPLAWHVAPAKSKADRRLTGLGAARFTAWGYARTAHGAAPDHDCAALLADLDWQWLAAAQWKTCGSRMSLGNKAAQPSFGKRKINLQWEACFSVVCHLRNMQHKPS